MFIYVFICKKHITHIHTHTRTHPRTDTHTHSHTHSHIHTHTHTTGLEHFERSFKCMLVIFLYIFRPMP